MQCCFIWERLCLKDCRQSSCKVNILIGEKNARLNHYVAFTIASTIIYAIIKKLNNPQFYSHTHKPTDKAGHYFNILH